MDEMINEEVIEETEKKSSAKKSNAKKIESTVKPVREYKPNDIIQCHSVFPGRFLFSGPKTKAVYPFEASGDICYVEYQDLLSAMLAKKKSIMAPYIVVDDEDLLETIHWKQVKKIYDDMYAAKDLDKLLDMPFQTFKKNFEKLPIGAKRRVMMTISSRVRSGEFSEMNKIRLVDEACSSNIAVLLSR
jgi:hypothetical protein